MTQNLRVATWLPITDPAVVGSVVRTTASAGASERIPTEFSAGGGSGGAAIAVSDTPPGSPPDGMLWWESDSGRLYLRYRDATSAQWVLAHPIGGGGGAATLSVGDTPPGAPADGQLWWESDSGKLYLRYRDATSSQWVLANPIGGAAVTVMHDQENRLRAIEGLPPLTLQEFKTGKGL